MQRERDAAAQQLAAVEHLQRITVELDQARGARHASPASFHECVYMLTQKKLSKTTREHTHTQVVEYAKFLRDSSEPACARWRKNAKPSPPHSESSLTSGRRAEPRRIESPRYENHNIFDSARRRVVGVAVAVLGVTAVVESALLRTQTRGRISDSGRRRRSEMISSGSPHRAY